MKNVLPLAGAALLAVGVLCTPALAAQPKLSAPDRAAIRSVISRQIEAFRRDDAAGAFALTSPGIQGAFGTPENFLRMVRDSYQAVYRPASVTFLEVALVNDEVVQKVRLSDSAGAVWLALYPVERQKDGSWKTNGCKLFPLDSIST
jgi:Domain of unknown function (DUF4864)